MIPPIVPSTDERFLRLTRNEQVRKRRRARSLIRAAAWAGLHLAVAGVVGLAAWGAYRYLTHSERFRVTRVLVAGGGYVPEREIKRVTAPFLGKNIFAADLGALQSRLESQSWIKTARAKRRIPDVLLIQIEERVPEVLVKVRDGIYLADGEGTLLDRFGPEYADYDFPILTGLDSAGRDTLKRKVARGATFVNYLYRTHPQLADQVSEIDVERDDALEVRLNDGGPPLKVSPDAFELNLDNYLAMRNYIASNYGDVRYVDLRWKDRLSILPAEGRSSEDGTKR
ncbi:MAG TPA: FtsQ-type POTRA domain-containing protein [Candidatus Polarisedimenticolia bacterium]|nr:FtsQ-type POTRA domain-containing protein [Candidatus Polarisedimenticolia bacterium]